MSQRSIFHGPTSLGVRLGEPGVLPMMRVLELDHLIFAFGCRRHTELVSVCAGGAERNRHALYGRGRAIFQRRCPSRVRLPAVRRFVGHVCLVDQLGDSGRCSGAGVPADSLCRFWLACAARYRCAQCGCRAGLRQRRHGVALADSCFAGAASALSGRLVATAPGLVYVAARGAARTTERSTLLGCRRLDARVALDASSKGMSGALSFITIASRHVARGAAGLRSSSLRRPVASACTQLFG